jgi:hypothetical protein
MSAANSLRSWRRNEYPKVAVASLDYGGRATVDEDRQYVFAVAQMMQRSKSRCPAESVLNWPSALRRVSRLTGTEVRG